MKISDQNSMTMRNSRYSHQTVSELLTELHLRGLQQNGHCKDIHITRLWRDDKGLAQLNFDRFSEKTNYGSKSMKELAALKSVWRKYLDIPDLADKDTWVACFVADDYYLAEKRKTTSKGSSRKDGRPDEEDGREYGREYGREDGREYGRLDGGRHEWQHERQHEQLYRGAGFDEVSGDSDEASEIEIKSESTTPLDFTSSSAGLVTFNDPLDELRSIAARASSPTTSIRPRSFASTGIKTEAYSPIHTSPSPSPITYEDHSEDEFILDTIEDKPIEDTADVEHVGHISSTIHSSSKANAMASRNKLALSENQKVRKRKVGKDLASASAASASKRQRTMSEAPKDGSMSHAEFASLLRGPAVNILIGPEKISYSLPKALALHFSPVLKAAFTRDFKESEELSIHFEEDDPKDFDLIVEWMYSCGTKMTISVNPDLDSKGSKDAQIDSWLRITKIADRLLLSGHCDKFLHKKISNLLQDKSILSSSHIQAALQLSPSHPVRSMLLNTVAFEYIFRTKASESTFKFQSELDENPSEFLAAVGELLKERSLYPSGQTCIRQPITHIARPL